MNNKKITILITLTCLLIYSIYYNIYDRSGHIMDDDSYFSHQQTQIVEPIYYYYGTEDYLIDTPGCYIPNYAKRYFYNDPKYFAGNCGDRAVFIDRFGPNEIYFLVNNRRMRKYNKNNENITCYYNFARRSNMTGREDTQLTYTKWMPFKHGTKVKLEEEICTVKCTTSLAKNVSPIYEDAYAFIKKVKVPKRNTSDKNSWNVLLIGMDTMSRARMQSTMPNTVEYFKVHGWLDFRGYQKVGFNTFPNLMAVLTGKQVSNVYKECAPGMDNCNDHIIWSKFRKAGYVTAYGEDYLRLPDTFSRHKGFRKPPTDHYLRPLFLTGEKQIGNLICAKHKSSGQHLLDYALEFANVYRRDKFFATFWINSFSHNFNNIPTLIDTDMVDFFEQLHNFDVLNNTIVVMFSDHGIRYGKQRRPVESYYEERLPMLYVWIPDIFRTLNDELFYNLKHNQNRLVTPYDLYVTLAEISDSMRVSNDVVSEACPQCKSLFRPVSTYRTCEDASVDPKWCTCHDLIEIDPNDNGANTSLHLAVQYIQNVTASIKTTDCMECYPLQLDSVLRSHTYQSDAKKYYVVAWKMEPGDVSFEATVVEEKGIFRIVQPTETISAYNIRGNCVLNSNDRAFCVCKSVKCKNVSSQKF